MSNTIDLNHPPDGHNYNVIVEPSETDGERKVRLLKDVILFMAAIVAVGAMLVFCFVTMMDETTSPDEKKWAMSMLSGAIGGLLGYLIGK